MFLYSVEHKRTVNGQTTLLGYRIFRKMEKAKEHIRQIYMSTSSRDYHLIEDNELQKDIDNGIYETWYAKEIESQ